MSITTSVCRTNIAIMHKYVHNRLFFKSTVDIMPGVFLIVQTYSIFGCKS